MLIKATDQGKQEFCIALFNRNLHKNNKCPGNYSVDYRNGWFYWAYGNHDECHAQRPELTAEADELMRSGSHEVWYSDLWNTYVLMPVLQA